MDTSWYFTTNLSGKNPEKGHDIQEQVLRMLPVLVCHILHLEGAMQTKYKIVLFKKFGDL